MTERGTCQEVQELSMPVTQIQEWRRPGMLTTAIRSGLTWINEKFDMSTLKKTIKAGLIAGACGVGICALARKLNLSTHAADFIHSIEAGPFPGANLYDFLTARNMRTMYTAIAEDVVAENHFDKILNLNTGTGYLPIDIAAMNPNTSIVGIDDSPGMIQIAETNARASKVGKSVEFTIGDSTNLPFPGRYFDLAVSVTALHHWRDPLAVFQEIYHVLQPGGQFWIYDYRREVPGEIWDRVLSKMPLYLRLPFMVGPMASWRASLNEKDLLDLASQTHFEVEKLEHKTFTIFGESMPVFNRFVLVKREQIREETA